MNELLSLALEAHGGIDKWNRLDTVAVDLSIGGALWDLKGQAGLFSKATYEADIRIQRATLGHFGSSSGKVLFKVHFPDNIATHAREQISYFGPDGLLRRHDYAVDILGGATGAHYVDDYQQHDGIMIPHRRRIYPRGADNQKIPSPVLVSIDIGKVEFHGAPAKTRDE